MASKTEIQEALYDFDLHSSRLLNTRLDDFQNDLEKFLAYIDTDSLISSFVQQCVAASRVAGFDAGALLDAKEDFEPFGAFGVTEDEEAGAVYLLLAEMHARNIDAHNRIFYSYGAGSKKYQDKLTDFLRRVAGILIRHIGGHLKKLGIRAGLGNNVHQEFNLDNSAAQICVAENGSTVEMVQNNGSSSGELESLFDELLEYSEKLENADEREAVQENVDGLRAVKDVGDSGKPAIRAMLKSLKLVFGGTQFAAAALDIVDRIAAAIM